MSTSPSNEQEIWRAFREGDREAFAILFDRHYRQLYAYGRQFLDDESLAEDAIQDLFITLWRTRENLTEEIDHIKFYLFRCLRRNIRRLSDREKRFQGQEVDWTNDEQGSPAVLPDYMEDHEESLLVRRLKAILAQLPRRQREAVMLRYYDNFKTEEIALIMGVSEKTVRNTLFNAMTFLRGNSGLLKASLTIGLLLLILFS